MVENEKDKEPKNNGEKEEVPSNLGDQHGENTERENNLDVKPTLTTEEKGNRAPDEEPPVVPMSNDTLVVTDHDRIQIDTTVPVVGEVIANGLIDDTADDATEPTGLGIENECIEMTTSDVLSPSGREPHSFASNEDEPDRVAVALPLNEDQLIYEARREGDDQCCTVIVWWLRPIFRRITKKNVKWVILGFILFLIAIIVIAATASGGSGNATEGPNLAEGSNTTSTDGDLGNAELNPVPTLSPSMTITSTPTTVESFERIQNVTSIIAEMSDNDLFLNISTSQGKALNWILHEDELQASSSYPTLLNRYALMVMYFALQGENWIQKSGYGTEPGNANVTHECDWHGVTCSEDTGVPTALGLVNNNLMGTIPEEIGFFQNLTLLELFQNNVGGTIPESVYTLEHLTKFYVYGNVIQGTLSTAIGNLKKLTHLSLRTNNFEGPIPSEIGLLDDLIIARLYSNNFTGGFPGFIGNNKNLLVLNFGDNKLTGPLSPDIGNLTVLKNLYFYDNNFTGTVPKEWGGLTDLRKTGMWKNELTGTFPTEYSQLPNLLDLSIGDNNFVGPMPYNTGLEELWIYLNKFTGSIPSEIGTLKSLKLLSAWNNSLSGSLPDEIGNLTSIITMELSNNDLSGQVPSTIDMLGRAITLDLSGNEFTGEVPESLASLPVLNALSLHFNNFSGTVPVEFCDNFMNSLTSDCEEVVCDCCTCCYGADLTPSGDEC